MHLAAEYPVTRVCALWGLARSTYYYQAPPADEAAWRKRLGALAACWPPYGSRRLTAHLRRAGGTIKRKHVLRLMHELGLVARPARKRVRTTNSAHSWGRYPNRVQQRVVERPDQVWVCDLNYIKVHQDFVYLAVLMDVYTRSIRGWHLGLSGVQIAPAGLPGQAKLPLPIQAQVRVPAVRHDPLKQPAGI